ncbi:hypothetical protein PV10_04540 [Exophiala mesophila]|uniref:ER-bound oxygenase mpaB/mpaB'/Rubber oxygenase catalytic domain-containing protein n=1 Tax=Exophiala mesophila TaxID=212818 RepID=A0A0D1WVE4_EXOME|nr:uncharacterized protein PV10_04540 [Exophiala mesophila]KIV93320.1 hypothetical protein PV10_04540 [Exophiala mesophila]
MSDKIKDVLSWRSLLVIAVIYLVIVRILRYHNLRRINQRYGQFTANANSLDYKSAHEIMKLGLLYEFPFMWGFGTQWALVKSYGIANGTKLLVQTRQLTDEKTVGKRAEDTGVFLGEILVMGVDSERGMRALAKMNWLHRRYGAKITNGDLIHTLALFILESQRWIDAYEWRKLTDLEKVASFVYWKEIGNRMGIKNIPDTLDELKTWTVAYEKDHMFYTDDNKACVDATVNLFLRKTPQFLHGAVRTATAAFLEPYARPSLGVQDPPYWVEQFVHISFRIRAFLVRHTFLPRIESPFRTVQGSDGRLHRRQYLFEPWYVQETWRSRLSSILGLSSGPHPGPKFKSDGFLPEELGPLKYEHVANKAVALEVEQLNEYCLRGGAAGTGCPFAFHG